MLTTKPNSASACHAASFGACRQRGFSLIELMVALVVTLIVTLAAVSFITSIARASSDGIRVTRLTQELRSLSEVMSREIRRARYVSDPIALVGLGAAAVGNDAMGIGNAGSCFFYQYSEPPPSGALVQRSIYLNNGRVFIAPDAGCGTIAGGNAISSTEVSIDQLQFAQLGSFQIDQIIRGRLLGGNTSTQAVNRQFRQTTFIRSGQVN